VVAFPPIKITNTLAQVVSLAGLSQVHIAETEKYAHVTYFFGGGREKQLPTETWKLIPSIPAHDYVHNPQMSAAAITDAVLASLTEPFDFYLINYANADMVGHSGNFEATKKAVEILDQELNRLYEAIVKKLNGTLYITADHGNAEQKQNLQTGQSQTAHTTNPIPFFMIRQDLYDQQYELPLHELADVAPFILREMNIEPPSIMKKLS
jgi:2,3-bisphosphoglycerate-independent phosphoglycerate mutase